MRKFTFILVCLFWSCNPRNANRILEYTRIPINTERALTTLPMSEIFSEVSYIPLETSDENLIGTVNQLLVYQDRFYVLDEDQTQSVYCFTQEGKFQYKIDRKGKGPGEYSQVNRISIDHDNNNLLLFCAKSHQVLVFHLEGNYIRSHRIDLWANDFSYMDNDIAVFFGDYTRNERYAKNQATPNLLITDTKGYKVHYLDLFFPSTVNFSALSSTANSFSSYHDGTVALIVPYNDTIYQITSKSVKREFYIDFGQMKKKQSFYSLSYNPATTLRHMERYRLTHDECNLLAMSITSTHLFFAYSHKDYYHFVFYNKQSAKLFDVYLQYGKDDGAVYPFYNDLVDGAPFAIPYATDGKSFYGITEAYEYNKLKRFDHIRIDDNPVIVKMTPKNGRQ
ncbi:MAG: 6-bladed beta-propeller [Mangrovibacterium sp.]